MRTEEPRWGRESGREQTSEGRAGGLPASAGDLPVGGAVGQGAEGLSADSHFREGWGHPEPGLSLQQRMEGAVPRAPVTAPASPAARPWPRSSERQARRGHLPLGLSLVVIAKLAPPFGGWNLTRFLSPFHGAFQSKKVGSVQNSFSSSMYLDAQAFVPLKSHPRPSWLTGSGCPFSVHSINTKITIRFYLLLKSARP